MLICSTKFFENLTICIFITNYFLPQYACSVGSESRCLSEKNGVLPVKCPSNKIARVLKAFYGYSWSSDCHFIEKDCVVNVPADDINCLASDCSIKIIETPIILQDCWNLLSSYVQVDYECLSVDEFKNICDVQESENPYGYLVTPGYPRMLQGELSCPCTLHVEKGYNIKLEVIDFRIGSCTQTGLTIWSDSYASTHCATISTDSVLPGGQNISMRLHSQTEKSNSGFLIKYYATPLNSQTNVKLTCYGTTQVKPSRAQSTKTQSFPVPNDPRETTLKNSEKKLLNITNATLRGLHTAHTRKINSKVFPNIVISSSQNHSATHSKPNEDVEEQVSPKGGSEWTIIIICIVASVVFILIMINALIWFMFSLKEGKVVESNNTVVFSKSGCENGFNYWHDNKLWRSSESLKAFPDAYMANGDQMQTKTWPYLDPSNEQNLMSQMLPYNLKANQKSMGTDGSQSEDFKEFAYIKQFNKRTEHADLGSNVQYKSPDERALQAKHDSNWSKYPKTQAAVNHTFNNPAVILDEKFPLHAKYTNKTRSTKYNSNICGDNMSNKNSTLNSNDSILLKSASQVPPNMHNSSLFEEQIGNIDLRSELSCYGKNSYKQFRSENNVDAKLSNTSGHHEFKEIKSWKDVD